MSIANEHGSETASAKGMAVQGERQHRSVEEKRQIVEETLRPGTSVVKVAKARGIGASQVFKWRRLYKRGLLRDSKPPMLVPVQLSDATVQEGQLARSLVRGSNTNKPGTIHIELASARVSIEGSVDAATVRAVLECMAR